MSASVFYSVSDRGLLESLPHETIRDFYQKQGYLILDAGVPEDLPSQIVADVRGKFDPSARQQDAWKDSEPVKRLATHAPFLSVLEELYGRKPLPFQTLNFPVGTEQRVHSDTIHFNCVPSGFMCGIWTALENIDAENGPLVFYPGSHRLPEYDYEDAGLAPGKESYPAYESFIQGVIDRSGFQPRYATMKKGFALIWAANLLHGGALQKDKARTRHSQVTHYFFERADYYYTPLLSAPGKPFLRAPDWIA